MNGTPIRYHLGDNRPYTVKDTGLTVNQEHYADQGQYLEVGLGACNPANMPTETWPIPPVVKIQEGKP